MILFYLLNIISIGNDPRFQITDERFAIEEDEEDNDEDESDEDDGLNIFILKYSAGLFQMHLKYPPV